MQFVTGPANKVYLSDIQNRAITDCTRVRVAMAYAGQDNMSLLESCLKHDRPLDFFGRYDHTLPIAPEILKWFLDQNNLNLRCRLIPEWLHAKIIWWVDHGAYIGSANLTDRAWFKNFEGGTFLTEQELSFNGMDEDLESYFSILEQESHSLTEEIYLEQLAIQKHERASLPKERGSEEAFWKQAIISRRKSLIAVDRGELSEKAYVRFREEWNKTLQVMRSIGHRLSATEAWPDWLSRDVSMGALTDQFLHAFYYNQVGEGSSYPYEEFYNKNKNNPDQALREAMIWWKEGNFNHEHEQNMMEVHAERLRKLLSEESIPGLTLEEFSDVVAHVFAMRDHASKLPNTLLGLPDERQEAETKIEKFAELLWNRRSKTGHDVKQLIHHVIWGSGDVTRRLWEGQKDPDWKIDDISRSTLGELVGWARPDDYPPRNQRSSKALHSLGYGDVFV